MIIKHFWDDDYMYIPQEIVGLKSHRIITPKPVRGPCNMKCKRPLYFSHDDISLSFLKKDQRDMTSLHVFAASNTKLIKGYFSDD